MASPDVASVDLRDSVDCKLPPAVRPEFTPSRADLAFDADIRDHGTSKTPSYPLTIANRAVTLCPNPRERIRTMPAVIDDQMIYQDIRTGRFDFADFGSCEGGSIDYCSRRFDAPRGLGIDILQHEVDKMRASGFDALCADITTFDCPAASFRFVSMMDFLEHLPNFDVVERILGSAKRIARDFLFIRHPSFEDEHYLNAVGLKQYWTDWPGPGGHTAKMTVADFTTLFRKLGINQYAITFRCPALDASDSVILPIDAPPNQHHYDEAAHGPKPLVRFPRPIYGQIDIFACVRPIRQEDWSRIILPFD